MNFNNSASTFKKQQTMWGVLSLVVLFATIVSLAHVLSVETRKEYRRVHCETMIHAFLTGSDVLTNEVFAYADTGDAAHLYTYWTEALQTKSRDNAVADLRHETLSEDEKRALENAARYSDKLMLLETHAMRLIAQAQGMTPDDMPEAVAAYELTADEEAMTAEAKSTLARELLFGRDYMTQKTQIIREVQEFSYSLNNRFGESATAGMRFAWITVLIDIAILSLMILLYQRSIRRNEAFQREELRQREECFRVVANKSGHFVYRYDIPNRTCHVITVRDEATDMPDVTKEPAQGEAGVIEPDSQPTYRAFIARISAGETPPETDVKLIKTNGVAGWYRFSASLVYGSDGRAVNAVVSYVECDRQREQELAFSHWTREMAELETENVLLHEWNLTHDFMDSERGLMRVGSELQGFRRFDDIARLYAESTVDKRDAAAYRAIMDREKLIGMYHSGVYNCTLDYRELQEDRSQRWMRLTIRLAMYPTSGDVKAYVMKQDIDDEKLLEMSLIQQSELDSLTGAYNHRTFVSKVTELLKKAPHRNHLIMMLDIDEFKRVNDTFGHDFGDKLLQSFTEAARRELRPGDLIGRIGGDEFMICIPNLPDDSTMVKKARQIIQALRTELNDEHCVTVSMGVSVYSRNGVTFEELYKKADVALYKIKKSGKNSFCFYMDSMGFAPDPHTRTIIEST